MTVTTKETQTVTSTETRMECSRVEMMVGTRETQMETPMVLQSSVLRTRRRTKRPSVHSRVRKKERTTGNRIGSKTVTTRETRTVHSTVHVTVTGTGMKMALTMDPRTEYQTGQRKDPMTANQAEISKVSTKAAMTVTGQRTATISPTESSTVPKRGQTTATRMVHWMVHRTVKRTPMVSL
jgi:hypothetical protein